MKGDFSRQTFNHTKHYSGVLMQQGRVQLDADGNEAQAILRYRDQTEATDVIGVSGAPEDLAGFEITAQDSTLTIGAGRYYVDGIVCENDTAIPYAQQLDLPNPPDPVALLQGETNLFGLVYLDVWQRHITALDDASIRESSLGSDGPDTTTRIKNVWQVKVLQLAVDLTPLINTLKNVQSELQNIAQTTTNSTAQKAAVGAAKTIADFLASPTNDFQSLDKAIAIYGNVIAQLLPLGQNPPDTADWLALERTILELEGRFLEFEANLPTQDFAEWDGLINVPTRTLKARTQPTDSQDNPCLIPPSAGYQLLENQLYRVEILQGGDPSKDTVSFVWSRDNGSVVTAITTSVNAGDTTVTVDSLGPDNELGFAKTQTVEILDDSRELYDLPGQLATITDINSATHVVTLDRALNPVSVQMHAKMRRWDGEGLVTLPATPDDWIALEGGIQVQFAAGTYRTGDYWLIPARVGGGIQWPTSPSDGSAIAQPPLGIQHHYSRLALILLEQESLPSSSPTLIFIARHPIVNNLLTPVSSALGTRPSTLRNLLLNTINASIAGEVNRAGIVSFGGLASTVSILQVWDCRSLFPALATPPPAMHVVQTNWRNDSIISPEQLVNNGLAIVLDHAPDPNSLVDGATMIVTVEVLTFQNNIPPSYQAFNLIGEIQVLDNVIWWSLLPVLQARGLAASLRAPARMFAARGAVALITQYRIHVTLKGHAIWQAGTWQPDTRPYLDGQVLGIPGEKVELTNQGGLNIRGGTAQRTMVDLLFPSGTGTRASDFESWFYLSPPKDIAPFQVSTVNFLSVTNVTPEPSPVHSISVPPIPSSTDPKVQFNVSDQINAIDVIFNRTVSTDSFKADDLQKGLSVELTINGVTTVLLGTLTVKADGVTVRFTDAQQQVLPAGSYQLILISEGAAGPLVKAADDGAALDGDFNGQPGGNFVFPFTISFPIG